VKYGNLKNGRGVQYCIKAEQIVRRGDLKMRKYFLPSIALALISAGFVANACFARDYVERVYTYGPGPYADAYPTRYDTTYVYRGRESGAEKVGKGAVGLGDRSTKVGVGVAGKAAKTVLQTF
jgi:hypothetical protein